ncbi:MAG: hypothetical protein KA987_13690, partial [Saprospiraceae bacterium]|nr:hypothetical protein [Saprospiraceae bacterium]
AGSFQHYIYDANGERTLKGLGQYGIMDLNGLSQTVSTIGNYSQYVSGYMVMGPHYMVTNHYYSGTERIACKLVGSVDSSVDNSLELSGTEKAGLPDRQAEDLELVRTEFGFDTLIIDDVDPDEDDCEGNNDCPNVLYFFHPDHIGSSTFLTDEAGNPYQFILYLPFGEGMAEQKAGGYSTKYRFTGKEVDEETGLYYFGARYYDPRISLWYGVDPLASKYPSISPYAYVANNPINAIDPDGREIIIITGRDSKGNVSGQLRYSNGTLYTMSGKEYKGNNSFALTMKNAFNDIRKADTYIDKMVNELEGSENSHFIEFSKDRDGAYVTENENDVNGNGTQLVITNEELNGDPLSSGEDQNLGSTLSHELQHVSDIVKGVIDRTPDKKSGIKNSEIKAVNTENRYRANRNMDKRTHYGEGNKIPKSKLEDPCKAKEYCQASY